MAIGCGGSASHSTPTLQEPPRNVNWINPGKIIVDNFYAGATAEYNISVHNGNNYPAQFIIKYRYPDHVGEGYDFPPENMSDWVTVIGNDVEFKAYETKDIIISITIPENVVLEDKWEFWVSVIDDSQSGMVKTELCTRWLITME